MIDVLLATYNGEAFLAEQIDSVLAQEAVRLRILARDDGSADGTPAVLERYARAHADRFTLLRSPGRLGAAASFGWLLEHAQAPYVAFCDQDDVWEPAKLKTLLARIRAHEARLGERTPVLAHCDLAVVDAALAPLQASFWRHTGIDPARCALPHVLLKNPVTGCALLANRALVEKARPIPPEAAMHDHWLALVAASFGRIDAVATPLVRYRQHGRNVVGARSHGLGTILRRVLTDTRRLDLARPRGQARAFFRRYANELDAKQRALVDGFARLPERTWLGKRAFLLWHGILFPDLVRNLALMLGVRLGR
jgi:glycosyltransferase involved in cell wall biosynthesis